MARVFSGIQPSGELHIGNYLGAVQNWVRLQSQHDCIFAIVDLHAITQPYDTSSLPQRTLDMAIGLLAAGLDPERCTLFVQSQVPEHTELNWLLNTVAPLGELERAIMEVLWRTDSALSERRAASAARSSERERS